MSMKIFYSGKPGKAAVADIVFLHGLGGDAVNSWAVESTCWVRDFLKLDLEDVRILSFQYDAGIFSPSRAGVFGHAQTMLSDLALVRSGDHEAARPIVFVGHSLGGLIIKSALIRSFELSASGADPDTGAIYSCTKGIVFIGTPHRGSDILKFSLADIAASAAQATWKSPNKEIIRFLKSNSGALNQQRTSFTDISQPFQMVCLYEQYKTKGFMIVPEDSACFDGRGVRHDMIPGDHRSMCKFASRNDVGYLRTLGHIRRILQQRREGGSISTSYLAQEEVCVADKALSAPMQRLLEDIPHQRDTLHRWEASEEPLLAGKRIEGGSKRICELPPPPKLPVIGRHSALMNLMDVFQKDRISSTVDYNLVHVSVLSGLAGVGKSAIALEYAYNHKEDFDLLLWMPECDVGALRIPYQAFGNGLTVSKFREKSTDGFLIEDLKNASGSWLLVFDHVGNINDVLPQLPKESRGIGSVIITTQQDQSNLRVSPHGVFVMPISPLDAILGGRLFCTLLWMESIDSDQREDEIILSHRFSQFLGGIPALIVATATFLRDQGSSLEDFFDQYKLTDTSSTAEILNLISDVDGKAITLFDSALGSLSKDSKDAYNFIAVLSLLDSASISESLFSLATPENSPETMQEQGKKLAATDALFRNLNEYSLVTRVDKKCVAVNPAVQSELRNRMEGDQKLQRRIFEKAFHILREVTPRTGPETTLFQQPASPQIKRDLSLEKHILGLWKVAKHTRYRSQNDFVGLLYDLGHLCWQNDYSLESGIQALRDALSAMKKGEVYHDTVNSKELEAYICVMLGRLYRGKGRVGMMTAQTFSRTALEIRQSINNTTSADYYTRAHDILFQASRADIASDLLEMHHIEEALVIYNECLTYHEKWHDGEKEVPYDWARVYYGIAFCYFLRGDWPQAEASARMGSKVMSIKGSSNMTKSNEFLEACILTQCGKSDKALKLHKEVRKARRELYGASSVRAVQSGYAVGALVAQNGDLSAAASLFRELLFLTPHDCSWPVETVSRIQLHLAIVLQTLKTDPDEVQKLLKNVQATLESFAYSQVVDLESNEQKLALLDSLHSISAGRFIRVATLEDMG